MIENKFVVLLKRDKDRQVWMGYNTFGNLGTTDFAYAFRYDTKTQAYNALKKARRLKSWPDAVVLSTLEAVEMLAAGTSSDSPLGSWRDGSVYN